MMLKLRPPPRFFLAAPALGWPSASLTAGNGILGRPPQPFSLQLVRNYGFRRLVPPKQNRELRNQRSAGRLIKYRPPVGLMAIPKRDVANILRTASVVFHGTSVSIRARRLKLTDAGGPGAGNTARLTATSNHMFDDLPKRPKLAEELGSDRLLRMRNHKPVEQIGSGRMTDLERLGMRDLDAGAFRTLDAGTHRWLAYMMRVRQQRRRMRRILHALFPATELGQRHSRHLRNRLHRRAIAIPDGLNDFELAAYRLLYRQTYHRFWQRPAPPVERLLRYRPDPEAPLPEFDESQQKFLAPLQQPMQFEAFMQACRALRIRVNNRLPPGPKGGRVLMSRYAVVTRKFATSPSSVLRNRLRRKIREAARMVIPAGLVDNWDVIVIASPAVWMMSQADIQSELFSILVSCGLARSPTPVRWNPRLMLPQKVPQWPRRSNADDGVPVTMAAALLSACRLAAGPSCRSVEVVVLDELERLVDRCFRDESTMSVLMGKTVGKLDRLAVMRALLRRQYISPPLRNMFRTLLQSDQLYLFMPIAQIFRSFVLHAAYSPDEDPDHALPAMIAQASAVAASASTVNAANTFVGLQRLVPTMPVPEDDSPARDYYLWLHETESKQ